MAFCSLFSSKSTSASSPYAPCGICSDRYVVRVMPRRLGTTSRTRRGTSPRPTDHLTRPRALATLLHRRDTLRELRDHREQIPYHAVVRHTEDGRVRVLVDRHDRLRLLDSREMLKCTTDAYRQVELGGHGLARDSD